MLLMQSSVCDPGANPWVEKYFGDCLYTDLQAFSFALGLSSVAIWIIAQVPQFLSNIKNQSAEALSLWFMGQWLLGDLCNMLGCLIQGKQLPTTTWLAVWYVASDVILIVQCVYYAVKNRTHKRQHGPQGHAQSQSMDSDDSHQPSGPGAVQHNGAHKSQDPEHQVLAAGGSAVTASNDSSNQQCCQLHSCSQSVAAQSPQHRSLACKLASVGLVVLVTVVIISTVGQKLPSAWCTDRGSSAGHDMQLPFWCDPDRMHEIVGTVLGYVSSVVYVGSRFPQIYLTWVRKSAEGLSLSMFLMAMVANICTGSSILLRATSPSQLLPQLPWVIGSFGTVGLDAVIVWQSFHYRQQPSRLQLTEPLLRVSS